MQSAPLPVRFSSSAGIAIGPILFVIAILGVLAVAMSSNMGSFGTIGIADRVTADITSQANLIRTKINECNMKYLTDGNGDGYPDSDYTSDTPTGTGDKGEPVVISKLFCQGDVTMGLAGNLWTGARPAQLPPPTAGFNEWTYINAGSEGGRCFWTTPVSTSTGIGAGLSKALTKFSSQEAAYNATSQKIVIFVTNPTGVIDSHCTTS